MSDQNPLAVDLVSAALVNEKVMNTIFLKCESDRRNCDHGVREIQVTMETDRAWFGKPVANLECPVLEWPKFAWKVVEPCFRCGEFDPCACEVPQQGKVW